MKKFWKALGIAALAAAVPVVFKKDETTGKKKFQSLLFSVDVGPDEENGGTEIGLNLGDGLLTEAVSGLVSKKETVHFADDEPEAAVVEPIEFVEPEETKAEAEEGKAEAEEAKAEVEEIKAEEPEVTEEDFDPEG